MNQLNSEIFFNNDIKDRISDLILFLTLIFLEIDTIIFHESYDILIYLIFYIMFTNKHFFEFTNNLNSKKLHFYTCLVCHIIL